jgi:hypothetical protein
LIWPNVPLASNIKPVATGFVADSNRNPPSNAATSPSRLSCPIASWLGVAFRLRISTPGSSITLARAIRSPCSAVFPRTFRNDRFSHGCLIVSFSIDTSPDSVVLAEKFAPFQPHVVLLALKTRNQSAGRQSLPVPVPSASVECATDQPMSPEPGLRLQVKPSESPSSLRSH